jgi:hypothetical protein
MFQSFIVYGLFATILWKLGVESAKRESVLSSTGKETPFWVKEIVMAILLFALVSGIRWQVGVDHLNYLAFYENLRNGGEFRSSGLEIGFDYITKLFADLGLHFTFYFAFWAFLQIFFIYYAVRNERYLLPFLGIVIVMGPEYLSWMNGIRQMLAACMFIYSIQFIQNKSVIKYFLTLFLAFLIHKSAILLLIFYFIPQKNYFYNRYFNLLLLFICVIIGLNPYWIQTLTFFENALVTIGYEAYSENLDVFIDERREMVFGPRRIAVLLLNVFTIWYAPILKKVFKNTNYLTYFNFAFLGSLFYNLFANTSHLFLRPVSYFTIFLALTTSYLLYYLKIKKPTGVSFRFIIVFAISISFLLFSIIADYGKAEMDWTNYKFFWDHV